LLNEKLRLVVSRGDMQNLRVKALQMRSFNKHSACFGGCIWRI
jgi:hypothetical protein